MSQPSAGATGSSGRGAGRSGDTTEGGGVGVARTGNGDPGNENNTQPNQLALIVPTPTDLKLVMDYNKLKGQSNYVYWADRSQSGLEYIDLWDYVTGEIPKPPINNLTSREVWERNDKRALFLLKNCIEENIYSRIRMCSSASDLWIKLEDMYKLKGVTGKQAAWENWERVHLKEGGDVAQYLADHDTA